MSWKGLAEPLLGQSASHQRTSSFGFHSSSSGSPVVYEDSGGRHRFDVVAVFIHDANSGSTTTHSTSGWGLQAYLLRQNSLYSLLMNILCVCHLCLAIFEPPSEAVFQYPVTQVFELFCFVMHIVDTIVEVLAVSPHYFQSLWKRVKMGVLVVGLADNFASFVIGRRALLRWARVIRPYFLVERNHHLRSLVNTIGKTLPVVLNVGFILVVHLTIFACFFALLFARYEGDENPFFTGVWESFYNLFVLVTTANFPFVAMPLIRLNRAWFLVFVLYLSVALWILVPLNLAAIFSTFKNRTSENLEERERRVETAFVAAWEVLISHQLSSATSSSFPSSPSSSSSPASSSPSSSSSALAPAEVDSGADRAAHVATLPSPSPLTYSPTASAAPSAAAPRSSHVLMPETMRSSYDEKEKVALSGPDDPARVRSQAVIEQSTGHGERQDQSILRETWMKLFVVLRPGLDRSLGLVLFAAATPDSRETLSFEEFKHLCQLCGDQSEFVARPASSDVTPTSRIGRTLRAAMDARWMQFRPFEIVGDLIAVACFALVLVQIENQMYRHAVAPQAVMLTIYAVFIGCKVIGHGLREVLSSVLAVVDVILLGIALSVQISIVVVHPSGSIQCLPCFFPMLRLLRGLGHTSRLQHLMETLLLVYPALIRLLVVQVCLFYVFAIIGMQLFAFKVTTQTIDPDLTYAQNNYFANNFDSLDHAYAILFELLVVNDWWVQAAAFADATSKWSRIYFVLFYVCAVMVNSNVIIAFLVEAYVNVRLRRHLRRARKSPEGQWGNSMELTAIVGRFEQLSRSMLGRDVTIQTQRRGLQQVLRDLFLPR